MNPLDTKRGECTKCHTKARILVYRRAGASGTGEPETWLCAVHSGAAAAETEQARPRGR